MFSAKFSYINLARTAQLRFSFSFDSLYNNQLDSGFVTFIPFLKSACRIDMLMKLLPSLVQHISKQVGRYYPSKSSSSYLVLGRKYCKVLIENNFLKFVTAKSFISNSI